MRAESASAKRAPASAKDMPAVLILGARAPVALDHARRFAAQGWRVVAGDSVSCRITAWSRTISAHAVLPSARNDTDSYARALGQVIARHDIALVLPTCEEAFYLAHVRDRLPHGVRVCVGDLETMRALHSKWGFLALAQSAGMEVPASALAATLEEARAWAAGRPVVLKPEYSRFGVHVRLHPRGVPRDAAAFDCAGRWVVQAYCSGRELCSYSIADRGRLLAHVAYRPAYRIQTSSSYYFEACDAPLADATQTAAERLVAQLGYTGQISFDWIESADGRCVALECNPRAVSGVHLFSPDDDLPGALMGTAQACVTPSGNTPRMLAAVMGSAGLVSSLRSPRAMAAWWRDWRRARDVLAIPGDRLPLAGGLADLASYGLSALRQRGTLREAATCDTQWDGEPMDMA